MQELFNIPLKRNHKTGVPPTVNGGTHSSQALNDEGVTVRSSLITGMTGHSNKTNSLTLGRATASTRPRVGSVRSTRANVPSHDREIHEEQEPERYSETHGLGKPWAK